MGSKERRKRLQSLTLRKLTTKFDRKKTFEWPDYTGIQGRMMEFIREWIRKRD